MIFNFNCMKFFTIILFLYLSIIKNFNYDSIIYKLKVTERYENFGTLKSREI